jgi:hypothetical protein
MVWPCSRNLGHQTLREEKLRLVGKGLWYATTSYDLRRTEAIEIGKPPG